MRLTNPDGIDWRDFIRGIGEGAIQRVDNIVAAVSNPGKTLKNALKPAESIGEAYLMLQILHLWALYQVL